MAGAEIASSARTATAMLPMFAIVATMLSPARIGLTPSGVPVKMRSPG